MNAQQLHDYISKAAPDHGITVTNGLPLAESVSDEPGRDIDQVLADANRGTKLILLQPFAHEDGRDAATLIATFEDSRAVRTTYIHDGDRQHIEEAIARLIHDHSWGSHAPDWLSDPPTDAEILAAATRFEHWDAYAIRASSPHPLGDDHVARLAAVLEELAASFPQPRLQDFVELPPWPTSDHAEEIAFDIVEAGFIDFKRVRTEDSLFHVARSWVRSHVDPPVASSPVGRFLQEWLRDALDDLLTPVLNSLPLTLRDEIGRIRARGPRCELIRPYVEPLVGTEVLGSPIGIDNLTNDAIDRLYRYDRGLS